VPVGTQVAERATGAFHGKRPAGAFSSNLAVVEERSPKSEVEPFIAPSRLAEPFLTPPLIDDLIKQGKTVANTSTVIAPPGWAS